MLSKFQKTWQLGKVLLAVKKGRVREKSKYCYYKQGVIDLLLCFSSYIMLTFHKNQNFEDLL